MANIKSQIKRNRQNERRRQRNKAVRTALKTAEKKVRVSTTEGGAEAAGTQLAQASRALDRAVSGGSMHKRTTARHKSRLAKAVARSGADSKS